MALVMHNNKYVGTQGKLVFTASLPSEAPAISMLHNFITGVGAVFADWDRLPVSQAELETYGVDFSPSGVYTFAFFIVNASLCYCNATSSDARIHSFTRTVANSGGPIDIICEKLGTVAPGCADYVGGILSCQAGTQQV